jgi:small subunit ribosomal protein S1
MIHVSEIDPDKRIHHPQDVFRNGQVVKAQVIGIDPEKRQIKLSIKQMIPTGLDEYLAEHNVGDQVSGRLLGVDGRTAHVELGEGIVATCQLPAESAEEKPSEAKADLSALSAMLQSRWKTATTAKKTISATAAAEAPRAGQIRNFRIVQLDRDHKTISLELA